MVEQEAGAGMSRRQGLRLLPAGVDIYAPGTSGLGDRHVGVAHEVVERGGGGGVPSVGEHPAPEVKSVAAAVEVAVVELDGLVADPTGLAGSAGLLVGQVHATGVLGPLIPPGELQQARDFVLHTGRA